MSTKRVERIRADQVEVGDRIKAPEAAHFYEMTKAQHVAAWEGEGEFTVELGTGWGTLSLAASEMVERENWQVGEAEHEVEAHKRSRLGDLAALLTLQRDQGTQNVDDDELELVTGRLEALGVEFDGGELLEDQASRLLDEYPLSVETTTTFEVVLGTGGPDDRLLFECSGGGNPIDGQPFEIDRVLYRYSWTGSAERVLSGDDRETAEAFGRYVVPELSE